MLNFFTHLADLFISMVGLDPETPLGRSVHFFVEDTAKIFLLMYAMIFVISLFRSQLSPERVRDYLSGKTRWNGYIMAVFLGVVTPFCSCSSIPLFMGFLAAGIPFGITAAFLVSSPLISEVAAIMLLSLGTQGLKIALIYILSGVIISVLAGVLADRFKVERYLIYTPAKSAPPALSCSCTSEKIKIILRYANDFAFGTVKGIAVYVLIGLLIGAVMHGYVPQEIFVKYLGAKNPWSVPFASIAGIPIYANHASVVPIIQVLLMKGVPIGTALVLLMSTTAISLPEMIMLKKVFSARLLGLFVGYLIIAFVITGYVINEIS